MVLTIIQAQLIIAQLNNLIVSQQVHNMEAAVNFVISPFEGGHKPQRSTGDANLYSFRRGYRKGSQKVRYFSFKSQICCIKFTKYS